MMREMRRKNQLLSAEEAAAIFERGSHGVLALAGDDGYPYALPISYVYCDSKLYFHSAKTGHKIDAIKNCDKASFCVVDKNQIVPEEYTTYFRSAIAFGKIHILEEEEEKKAALMKLAMKYSGVMGEEGCKAEMAKSFQAVAMIELDIEHMTGKEAIELVRARKQAE